jgi:hypothetical protein
VTSTTRPAVEPVAESVAARPAGNDVAPALPAPGGEATPTTSRAVPEATRPAASGHVQHRRETTASPVAEHARTTAETTPVAAAAEPRPTAVVATAPATARPAQAVVAAPAATPSPSRSIRTPSRSQTLRPDVSATRNAVPVTVLAPAASVAARSTEIASTVTAAPSIPRSGGERAATAHETTTSGSAVSSGAFSAAAAGSGSGAVAMLALAAVACAALLTLLTLFAPLRRPILFISLTERPG